MRVRAGQLCLLGQLLGPEIEADPAASFAQRLAPMSAFVTTTVAPALGASEAALEMVIQAAGDHRVAGSTYAHRADSGAHVRDLGRAAARIDTAALHLMRAADRIDDAATACQPLPGLDRTRIRGHVAEAGYNLSTALNDIMWLSGSSAFAESSPLQQLWRDVNVAVRHAGATAPVNYEAYGDGLIGRDPVVNVS